MRAKRSTKRMISWFLTLVLMISMIRLPQLTLTARAEVTLTGDGSAANPYQIGNADDWATFAGWISAGTNADKCYKLTADINEITVMVGTSSNKFMGTFDGSGHTLTVSYNTTENEVAPFQYADGATIKNLHIAGTITTNKQFVGGLIAIPLGNCTISNCRSSVTIDSSKSGDGTHGGFIGVARGSASTVTFNNCLFDGQLLGSSTNSCGGFAGWHEGSVIINNCLFAPSAITVSSDNSATFARNGVTDIDHSYYTTVFGDAQGEDADGKNSAELADALNNGNAEWEVVGNTAVVPVMVHDPNKIQHAAIAGINKRYIDSGDGISITPVVTAADGTALTFGTHFTATLDSTSITSFPFTVNDEGDHTLTITGTGSEASGYYGSRTISFSVEYCPEGLSIDDEYTMGQDGYYYINMPKTGENTLTLPTGFTSSFKVYDNGGKGGTGRQEQYDTTGGNYSNNCAGTLILTAPENYVLQLSGCINTETNWDKLTVYDNSEADGTLLLDGVSSTAKGTVTYIQTVVSTGQSMTLYFYSDYMSNYDGLDLTVTLINANEGHNVNIPTTTGGTVAPDKSTAKIHETVTLTATPDEGCLLCDLSVTDADNNPVTIVWDTWSNTATFTMPKTAVTVTPVFSSEPFVNMPKTGSKTLIIPSGIQSFKVYDDGGMGGTGESRYDTSGGNYSNNCKGTLILTAPEDYKLQLSGSIRIQYFYDKLTVYDNDDASGTTLLSGVSSDEYDIPKNITTVESTGQSMTLFFDSNDYRNFDGLDLTVTLISVGTHYNITVDNPSTGGTVVSDKSTAVSHRTVTLTATPDEGYLLSDLSVVDANNATVDVEWDTWTNTASFTMPATDVTVTPTFTNDMTSLWVNMPKGGSKSAIIPMDVRSFKVYDDGGKDGKYSKLYDGSLVLTAPEGFLLQLSGNITTNTFDKLTVYDGQGTGGTKLLDAVTSTGDGIRTDIQTVVSSDRYMTLYFNSNNSPTYAGFDLTVTLINISGKCSINAEKTTGGTIASDKSKATKNETVTLTATPDEGYLLFNLSVKDADNNPVTVEWNPWSNTAAFTMPETAVTVTPTFSNEPFVNMPKRDSKTITIPLGVRSIKVYDDGGAGSNYSDYCSGTLVLTAPEGYLLQLSGSVTTEIEDDWLSVYDGEEIDSTKLLYKASSSELGIRTDIQTVVSTGQSMTLYFTADHNLNYDGLDLTVTIVATEGSCGAVDHEDDIKWSFQDGTLTITKAENAATGAMADYTFGDESLPWRNLQGSITGVVIGEGVTHIGDYAFNGCTNFASVTIPASVESIGKGAFFTSSISKNHLASVTFAPGSKCKTIGMYAFENLPITSVELPATVTSIGDDAFNHCSSLESVSYAGTGLSVGKRAFSYCGSLSGFRFDSVTSIGDNAFEQTGLTSVTLPDTLTSIGDCAFQTCQSLSSVTINGSGMTTVGEKAFYDCDSLKTVEISNVTSIGISSFQGCSNLETLTINGCDAGTSILVAAFEDCHMLANLTLKGVSTIGNYAFDYCTALESVEIPDGVTSIGNYAFHACSDLAFVILPPSVTSVGSSAFTDSQQDMIVYAPSALTLGADQFKMQSTTINYYSKVTLGDYVTATGTAMMPDVLSKDNYFVAGDTVTIAPEKYYILTGVTATNGGNSLTVVNNAFTMPKGDVTVATTAEEAKVTSVTLNKTALSLFIGVTATLSASVAPENILPKYSELVWTSDDESIATVDENGKVKAMAAGTATITVTATNGTETTADDKTATCLVTVETPEGNCGAEGHEGDVKWSFSEGTLTISKAENAATGAMADYTFDDESLPWRSLQSDITGVIIGEGVTHIGDYAFNGCTNFASVTIPASVESIGEGAFFTSSSISKNHLASVTFAPGSKCKTIGMYAFEDLPITSVELPATVTSIGDDAFNHCSSLESVSYAGTGLSVGKRAFSHCGSLSGFRFDSVTSIGDNAFQQTGLTSVTLPDTLTTIGDRAFQSCQSLSSVVINGSGTTTICESAFYDCDSLKTVEISGVTSIGNGAFESCSVLETLTITGCDAGTIIKYTAYRDCHMLESLTLKGKVSTIGERAFYACYALESVEFPDGVTSIGEYAFGNCENLAFVILPPSVTSVGNEAFFKYKEQAMTMTVYAPSALTLGANQFKMQSTTINYYSKVTLGDHANATGTAMTPDVLSKNNYFVEGDTVTTVPEKGYTITEVTATSGGDSLTVVNNAFTMPKGEVTVTAAWQRCFEKEVKIEAANVYFDGQIHLAFKFKIPEDVLNDARSEIRFFKGGEVIKSELLSNGKATGDCYEYYCPVMIPEFADEVTVRLYNGNDTMLRIVSEAGTDYSESGVTYSVKQYAEYMKDNAKTQKMKDLAKALLDYGTVAQIKFAYGNYTGLSADGAVTSLNAESFENSAGTATGNKPAGVLGASIQAFFEADNTLRVTFTLDGSVEKDNYTFKLDGKKVKAKEGKKNEYYLQVRNVAAPDLDEYHEFSISDGTDTYVITANVRTYAYKATKYGSDEASKNLGKALYLYSQAAEAYFAKTE